MFENQLKFAEQLKAQYGTALLSKAQTAKELSVSRATIDRMRLSGEITSKKVGSQIRFSVKEIARLVM
jgi:excisionase family DNA binding protein